MAEEKQMEKELDDELDQLIQDISAEEESPKQVVKQLPTSQQPVQKKTNAEQALTLELTGVINLKLCFASGERSIELVCSEDALVCRMADGTEFKIPTGVASKKKEAA